MHIRNLDLNLLVVFDALIREGSASSAATVLGMSQSGVSHALARLREMLDDPLFLRKSGRLVATPRAESLATPVREALGVLLDAVRTESGFDPASATREFRVVLPDNAEIAMLPPLLARSEKLAPGVTYRVRPGFARGYVADLMEGRLHVGLDLEAAPSEGLVSTEWFVDSLVLVGRRRHPSLRKKLNRRAFSELRHILYHPPDLAEPPLETMVRRSGVHRQFIARTASIGALVAAAATTDAVAIVPRRMAGALQATADLRTAELPFETPPLRTFLWWSARLDADPGHRWLREQLLGIAEQL